MFVKDQFQLDLSYRHFYNDAMKIAAVIFDLDGTLTCPFLDFDQIRAEIGNISGPILEAMAQMPPEQLKRAQDILHRHEQVAAENAQLNPGVHSVMSWLQQRQLQIGLVTRNRRRSVDHISQAHHLRFNSIVTREDGPVKPDPFPVLRACAEMNVQPQETVVVGDYLFDLLSATRAGALNVLLCTNENHDEFSAQADYIISSLNELPGVIDIIEDRAHGCVDAG